MASSSDDFSAADAAVRMKNRGPQFKFLFPLLYAPALPLIRIALRRNPALRDKVFYGALAVAFSHGAYLVTDLYDVESK